MGEEQRPNRKVRYEFVEKHKKFYCDGIYVLPSQMTEEEIKKWIPVKYQAEFLAAKNPTPLPTDKRI